MFHKSKGRNCSVSWREPPASVLSRLNHGRAQKQPRERRAVRRMACGQLQMPRPHCGMYAEKVCLQLSFAMGVMGVSEQLYLARSRF